MRAQRCYFPVFFALLLLLLRFTLLSWQLCFCAVRTVLRHGGDRGEGLSLSQLCAGTVWSLCGTSLCCPYHTRRS